jgi:hypothetical protein
MLGHDQERCLERILKIFYPSLVSNAELLRGTNQIYLEDIEERNWKWIGHNEKKKGDRLQVEQDWEEKERKTKTDVDGSKEYDWAMGV